MAELRYTRMQLAGADSHLAEDTVRLVEPENLTATGVVDRTLVPVGN